MSPTDIPRDPWPNMGRPAPPINPGIYLVGPIPPRSRLILVQDEVFQQGGFGTRTEAGAKLTAEWGSQSPQGWWDVLFTATDDGKMVVDRSYVEGLGDAVKTTLIHPSIRAKIRRRLEKALEGVYIP